MTWTGLRHAVGITYSRDDDVDLRNPLSVLGPAKDSDAGAAGRERAEPAAHGGMSWQYLIAGRSTVSGAPAWTFMGPNPDVEVPEHASLEQVASTLAQRGWKMLMTSPPEGSAQGPLNYIFRRQH